MKNLSKLNKKIVIVIYLINTRYIVNFIKKNYRPKCFVISFLIFSFYWGLCKGDLNLETSIFWLNTLPVYKTYSKKIQASCRIGPHNSDILSIIFGSLLGKGKAEIKNDILPSNQLIQSSTQKVVGVRNGTRITFFQEGLHVTYLFWLHNKLQRLGYCKPTLPKIKKRLGKKGKLLKNISFHTWTYTSFD
jgi:hypothetical protein